MLPRSGSTPEVLKCAAAFLVCTVDALHSLPIANTDRRMDASARKDQAGQALKFVRVRNQNEQAARRWSQH